MTYIAARSNVRLAELLAVLSLAADLASEAGLTLVGFLRGGSMNVYTRGDRVLAENAVVK